MSDDFSRLTSYGAPYFAVSNVPSLIDLQAFMLNYDIVPSAQNPDEKERPVQANKQRNMLKEIMQNPVNGYIACISGTQTDRVPKYLAAHVMGKARNNHNVRWVNLKPYSLNAMEILMASIDREEDQLVILSNLIPESTPYRFEAARDIIEHSSSKLKSFIIVTAGMTPHAFMADKLHIKPDYGIYLSSN